MRRVLASVPRSPWLALTAAVSVSTALILYLNRGTTFSFDELSWVLDSTDFSLRDAVEPYNGHLIFTSRVVYEGFLQLFGSSYLPFRFLAAGSVALLATTFFVYARPLIGSAAALAPSLILLFFGSDAIHVLAGNAFTVDLALACGLGALIALRRGDRRGEIAACALLCLGVITYTVALAFVVGAAVGILLDARRWHRIWIVAVPVALYVIWWLWSLHLTGSSDNQVVLTNLLTLPSWIFQSTAAALAAITGLGYDFSTDTSASTTGVGTVLAVVAIAALAWRLSRGRVDSGLWITLAVFLALASLNVVVANAFRTPETPRYLLPGSLALLLIAAAAVFPTRLSKHALVAIYLVAIIGVAGNIALLRDSSARFRGGAALERAELAAIDITGSRTPVDLDPSQVDPRSPLILPWATEILDTPPTAAYLRAAERFGGLGFSADELRSQNDPVRARADGFLIGVLGLMPTPAPPGSADQCQRVPAAEDGVVRIGLQPGQSDLIEPSADAEIRARRFATSDSAIGNLTAGQPVKLAVPRDGAPDPWQVSFAAPSARICEQP